MHSREMKKSNNSKPETELIKQSSLDRNHAFNYLVECRNLAVKLTELGMDIEVRSSKDRIILAGFEAVWLSGWLNDTELQGEVGLTPAHIATLGYLLAQQQSYNKSK